MGLYSKPPPPKSCENLGACKRPKKGLFSPRRMGFPPPPPPPTPTKRKLPSMVPRVKKEFGSALGVWSGNIFKHNPRRQKFGSFNFDG